MSDNLNPKPALQQAFFPGGGGGGGGGGGRPQPPQKEIDRGGGRIKQGALFVFM